MAPEGVLPYDSVTLELFTGDVPRQTKEDVYKRQLNVCIALLPALVASTLIFGARALLVTGVTVAACVGFEALYLSLIHI